jgi:hypothetical protein
VRSETFFTLSLPLFWVQEKPGRRLVKSSRMQKKEPIKVNCESRAIRALNKCRVAARRGQQEESPAAAFKISQSMRASSSKLETGFY